MNTFIENILTRNKNVVKERERQIHFDIDHEGKGLLNKQISKLYRKYLLSKTEIINIIVTPSIIIEKMSKLKTCGWQITTLNEQLDNGMQYYESRFDLNLNELLNNRHIKKGEFTDDLKDKFPARFKAIDGHSVRSKAELVGLTNISSPFQSLSATVRVDQIDLNCISYLQL